MPDRELFTFAGWRLAHNGNWSLRRWNNNNPSIVSSALTNLNSLVGWKFDRYGYELRVNGMTVDISSSGNWHPSVLFDRINEDTSLVMGELVLYPRILTDEENHLVEGYLANHWGLAGELPFDHPYKAGLPAGAEGLFLEGSPSQAGTTTVTINAANELGSASATFDIVVNALPPSIQTNGATQVGSTLF